jgi:hypothetical protein
MTSSYEVANVPASLVAEIGTRSWYDHWMGRHRVWLEGEHRKAKAAAKPWQPCVHYLG